jgi:predicted ATP-dependent endonuclease of OLD family
MPAERNAFIINYKILANRRLKLLLDQQRMLLGRQPLDKRTVEVLRESGELRYPKPVEDFLELLSDIELEGVAKVGLDEQPAQIAANGIRPAPTKDIKDLAIRIESLIQDGNKTRYRKTALGGRELIVSVPNGPHIDLYNASSSIKQIAPLLLYLRHRAAPNDILFIDEPEMNLHPESQAKLLEILAILVNKGVKVFLTTHSPYLMAHLNNLVLGDHVPDKNRQKQARSLYLRDPEALLNIDQVGAYEMKDNNLVSLKDPDYGIRWDTLSDVSNDIHEKFFEIYKKGHPKTSGAHAG